MKLILVPVLLILMLMQTFSSWLVVFEYNLNKDFITQKLCINKAKPKLNCNGKCQMMKRLAEEEKQNCSNTTSNTARIKLPELVFSNEINQPVIPSVDLIASIYNEDSPIFINNAPAGSVFHPPTLG